MKSIVFATNNVHKIREVRQILGSDWNVQSLAEVGMRSDLPETGTTLHENAEQKARAVLHLIQLPCFAEDSGLEVDALSGAPGVYTARYAGENASAGENNRKLLQELLGHPDRSARFRAVVALWWNNQLHFFEGVIQGTIAHHVDGSDGFGYDPLFIPEGYDKPFASLPPSVKNSISHRARAIEAMAEFLNRQVPNEE